MASQSTIVTDPGHTAMLAIRRLRVLWLKLARLGSTNPGTVGTAPLSGVRCATVASGSQGHRYVVMSTSNEARNADPTISHGWQTRASSVSAFLSKFLVQLDVVLVHRF